MSEFKLVPEAQEVVAANPEPDVVERLEFVRYSTPADHPSVHKNRGTLWYDREMAELWWLAPMDIKQHQRLTELAREHGMQSSQAGAAREAECKQDIERRKSEDVRDVPGDGPRAPRVEASVAGWRLCVVEGMYAIDNKPEITAHDAIESPPPPPQRLVIPSQVLRDLIESVDG